MDVSGYTKLPKPCSLPFVILESCPQEHSNQSRVENPRNADCAASGVLSINRFFASLPSPKQTPHKTFLFLSLALPQIFIITSRVTHEHNAGSLDLELWWSGKAGSTHRWQTHHQ